MLPKKEMVPCSLHVCYNYVLKDLLFITGISRFPCAITAQIQTTELIQIEVGHNQTARQPCERIVMYYFSY